MRAVLTASRPLASALASSSSRIHSRSLASSAITRAAGGHAASTDGEDYTTHETFGSPIWRNTILLLVGSFVGYRAWEVTQRHSSSSSSHDSHQEEGEEDADAKLPWLTRYIAYYTTSPEVWKERSSAHFDAARKLAEDKLFFQDTMRPPVQRLKYTQTFDQASPHGLAVGAQADLSDLKIKRT